MGISSAAGSYGEGGETMYQGASYTESAETVGAMTGGFDAAAYSAGGMPGALYEGAAYGVSGVSDATSAMVTSGGIGGGYSSFAEDYSVTGAGGAIDAGAGYGQYTTSMTASEGYSTGAGFGGIAGMAGGAGFGGAAGGAGEMSGALLPLNAYKIQVDPNPNVVRRMLPPGYGGSASAYRQNIMIRFLRPPAPPAPGPLIIKELRPPQPRPAPPLVIKQRPPRPRTPPPLVLRERPPRMPAQIKTQVVVKRLAALPAPPRQVIIERYPALPPKPRDVIIERWLQYGPLPKRRIVYQRAAQGRVYRTPKNMIIQYSSARPNVQRVFRRLGVVSMNPLTYSSAYGASLMDAHSLVTAARSAGVVENIAPPGLVYPIGGAGGFGGAISYGAEAALTAGGAAVSGYEASSAAEASYSESLGAAASYGIGGAETAGGLVSFGTTGAEMETVGGYAGGIAGGITGGITGGMTSQYEFGTSGISSDYIGGGYVTGFEESSVGTIQAGGAELQTEMVGAVGAEGSASYESSYAMTETSA